MTSQTRTLKDLFREIGVRDYRGRLPRVRTKTNRHGEYQKAEAFADLTPEQVETLRARGAELLHLMHRASGKVGLWSVKL